MSTRPSLRDHAIRKQPAPSGREAIYSPQDTNEATTSTEDNPLSTSTWEDTHRRVTFYCSLELLQVLEAEITNSGKSKSQVIVEALQAQLRKKNTP